MEENDLQLEVLQQIFIELQTMNQNFTSYQTYVTDRNTLFDEQSLVKEQEAKQKAEQEESEKVQAEAEQQRLEDQKVLDSETAVDVYLERLTGIENSLNDFKSESNSYYQAMSVVPQSVDNVDFNTSYSSVEIFVCIAILAIIAGFILGRVFFRKL